MTLYEQIRETGSDVGVSAKVILDQVDAKFSALRALAAELRRYCASAGCQINRSNGGCGLCTSCSVADKLDALAGKA